MVVNIKEMLKDCLNEVAERKSSFATKVLASTMALSANATMKMQKAARDKVIPPKEVKVENDRFAKYRSAEKDVIQQLVFYEGCVRKAYQDRVGIWTVGIGNTKRPSGEKVTQRDRLINNKQIYNYVTAHLEREIYPALDKYITRDLSPNEKAAVISLCYNCGTKVLGQNGKKSALAEAINKNDKKGIIKGFMERVSTKKEKFVDHLAVRRAIELDTYFGHLKQSDINMFYVGGQRGLKVSDVLQKDKNGRYTILKEDANTINKLVSHCMRAPSADRAPKYAWFGGDKRVSEFANLNNETYYAQAKDFQNANISKENGRM